MIEIYKYLTLLNTVFFVFKKRGSNAIDKIYT